MIYIYKNYIDFLDENNMPHRINGPSYISGNVQTWYKNGELHRLNGPAVIEGNDHHWYIKGKEYNETEYHKKLKEMGIMT